MCRAKESLANPMRHVVEDDSNLLALEAAKDTAVCGVSLVDWEWTRYRNIGAHDPTPTHYFVLERLFKYYSLCSVSHLLDVGCGSGRVLAYYLAEGLPGKITGVELDPDLAEKAQSWVSRYDSANVLQGSVLDLDLGEYTDFYLYNPFDSDVLQRFIRQVERQVKRPCTIVHMSDNGETWWYEGRQGWNVRASGEFLTCQTADGEVMRAFAYPQHYTVWRYAGS